MFQQGPFHGAMVGLSTVNGEWPLEVRVCDTATADESLETVDSAIYRMHDVEKAEGLFFGAYNFVGMKACAQTLIDVWM